ncbi:MAG: BatD family protein [Gloeobacteraceae cyanobacterium ES-bin-144]|nr:BatD family protein [Verrucomicrobiales bacterium]
MNGTRHFKFIPTLVSAWLCLLTCGLAQTTSRMSSRFLARGEQALLEVCVSGAQPTAYPVIPKVPGIDIRPTGQEAQTKLLPGRKLEYIFEYFVSSYIVGNHSIPAIEVPLGGYKSSTEPVEFNVFNPDDLKWSDAVSENVRFRYACAFRVLNAQPYLGEAIPVEIKVYVPSELMVEDWGIPDFQRDGVTAWRFQPSAMRGRTNLLGSSYTSVAYPSTLSPTSVGKVGIGPATVRLMTVQVVMDGVLRRISQEVHLSIPKLEMQSLALPQGAPEGFDNAVGKFQIAATTSTTDIVEGDPIPIDIVVNGSGNLDTMRPPKPMDADGWKIYEPTTEQRGDERRDLSGTVVFHQFLRPLELKPAIPPFRLVYFDPKERAYKTLTTAPIPLQMKPAKPSLADASAQVQSLATPVERMTDILAVLQPSSLTIHRTSNISAWLIHGTGALIALGLLLRALWLRFHHLFRKDPIREKRLADLREIERTHHENDYGFLQSAGHFIEKWLGGNPSTDLQAILSERDARCFIKDKSNASQIEPKRRDAILKVLRKAAMLWLFLLAMSGDHVRAEGTADLAQAAYDSANYDEAIKQWLKVGPYEELSPDVLYNIGNACYRAGSPGYAATYYRRALASDPDHPESRQNLRFIERKYGSITVHRPAFQDFIARLPLSAWQSVLSCGAWLCFLSVLIFPATRPGARARMVGLAALVIGPLLCASGALGWRNYPSDAEFAPIAKQAVIVLENSVLHTEAARTSPEVIDAPPGSLCEVIRESGRWVYVSLAPKTRGWLPIESIERIIPATPPTTAPQIHKPKANGKSA